jgi:hypothetical protein
MSEKIVENYLVDGLQHIAINNGIARVMFMRLDVHGKALSEVELNIPVNQAKLIAEGFAQAFMK